MTNRAFKFYIDCGGAPRENLWPRPNDCRRNSPNGESNSCFLLPFLATNLFFLNYCLFFVHCFVVVVWLVESFVIEQWPKDVAVTLPLIPMVSVRWPRLHAKLWNERGLISWREYKSILPPIIWHSHASQLFFTDLNAFILEGAGNLQVTPFAPFTMVTSPPLWHKRVSFETEISLIFFTVPSLWSKFANCFCMHPYVHTSDLFTQRRQTFFASCQKILQQARLTQLFFFSYYWARMSSSSSNLVQIMSAGYFLWTC